MVNAAFVPELVILIGGLILLILPIRSWRPLGLMSLAVLAAALALKLLAMIEQPAPVPLFYGFLVWDRLSAFFQAAILVTMMLIVLSLLGYAKEEVRSRREVYALVLLITLGLMILVGAQHLALVYVGMETVSILSYLLTGFLKKESLSVEAALKYFLFGSLATGVMLYGISLVYGLTGTMDLAALAKLFPKAMTEAPGLSQLTLFLLLAGLGFKVALVPFHLWAPDAYEGAPTPVTSFLSVAPKLGGFAVLIRIFLLGFSPEIALWPLMLAVLAILTMTLGNVVALVQTNVKRMLAYSSIAHAGTMAIGLAVATPFGASATLYYLIAYSLMNTGAFAGVIAVGNASGREDLGAFSGLSRKHPALAFMITVSFLSLAGIPPMAGFLAKLWMFAAALKAQAVSLAIVAALNSVIAVFYYMKVVKAMYLDPAPAAAPPIPTSRWLTLTLGISTAGLLMLGLMPGWWLVFSAEALPSVQPGTLPWIPLQS